MLRVENPIIAALTARVRRAGSEPLVTWYRPAEGDRTELSVKSFANWVDKTANLLETLGVDGLVAGPLSAAHPGHWMSLIWPLAAWQRGLTYRGETAADAELVVTGPERPEPTPGVLTIACSLHPLGLGLRGLPDGVLDFTTEALAEPDAHWAAPVAASAPAWSEGGHTLSHAQLAELPSQAARVLVRPTTAWETLVAALLSPLLGGGSAVVVEGEVDGDTLERIALTERVSSPLA